ncbi:coiled-coil domain-containing protein [Allorhizobium taibaishanense]|uniref:Rad50/SbcC-type AAA domain-containing protein n=1 Tax=Allorhizobium taibaishanense TaxID=887144 RepID=A0A1Q8ZZT1_9HYPH|nr:hypothetical protein [Allorhizobium taibaishanense]MBB4007176.1 hypothetical protein [Allorhizobium taibaishanense]OLP47807.1 hypothetical protein BJF91_05465 [Allorhizobium taibaishanense]
MADRSPLIQLEHLTYTGAGLATAGITFNDDLTILLGGSNTGKTYTVATLNFMFGGETPETPPEGDKYESALLGISFADGTSVTLRRALRGGDIEVFDGLAPDGILEGRESRVLDPIHGKGSKSKAGSLSEFLLAKVGLGTIKIASTQAGKLDTFSFRFLMPYVLVTEERMLSGKTPTEINPKSSDTLNKNAFRFLLTGRDDSTIAKVPDKKALDAGKMGKLQLLDEMIAELDRELGTRNVPELVAQQDRLQSHLETIGEDLAEAQERIDELSLLRRDALNAQGEAEAHTSQLRAMQQRFLDLKSTYETDIRRLEAIEEGGFLLQRFEDQPCPLCGALPGHQHKPHPLGDVDLQLKTARAEIAKIRRDMSDLDVILASLTAEAEELESRGRSLGAEASGHFDEIQHLRPREANLRTGYTGDVTLLEEIDRLIALSVRRSDLDEKRKAIAAAKHGKQKAAGLTIGIDGQTGHKFSQTVQKVLDAWGYPGLEAVTWNDKTYDIDINGKARGRNGKGVKALLRSAFAVAYAIYCKNERLPHPGLLVLDSPLLTYREELDDDEPLTDEERAIAATSLDERFYEHLTSVSRFCQIYVIENKTPPKELIPRTIVFSKAGRRGLFQVSGS